MRLNYSSENRYVRNNEDRHKPYNIWYILYTINNRITHQHTYIVRYSRNVIKVLISLSPNKTLLFWCPSFFVRDCIVLHIAIQ